MSCSKCKNDFSAEDVRITCSSCNSHLHYSCAELTAATVRKMGKEVSTWKCKVCMTKGQSSTGGDKYDQLANHMTALFKKFKNEISTKLTDFEKSVSFNSTQMDEILSGFKEMKKNFTELQAKQEELVRENATLKKNVKELQVHIIDSDQKLLGNVLELSGIPDAITEPTEIIESLCKKIQVNPPERTTYTLKRIPSTTQGKPKMTVITFASKFVRDEIIKAGKKYKPKVQDFTGASEDTQSVFVNEQLTPHNKKLFFNANKVKKEKGFAYLWVSDGRILLKKTQDSTTIKRILSIEDME